MHRSIGHVAALAGAFALSVGATGCSHGGGSHGAVDGTRVVELGVAQVAALQSHGAASIFDANTAETRAKYGVVPGAVLLGSSSGYDLSVLPSDKSRQLVFYCANTRCSASDAAASRAVGAGYEKVAVMRPGIQGWAEAGKPTVHPQG